MLFSLNHEIQAGKLQVWEHRKCKFKIETCNIHLGTVYINNYDNLG